MIEALSVCLHTADAVQKLRARGTDVLEYCEHALMPVLVGSPGIGKTARLKAVARLMHRAYYERTPAHFNSLEFAGALVQGDDRRMHSLSTPWVDVVNSAPTLLCFEELNSANEEKQSALMKCVHELRVGDIQLRPDTLLMGTMNPDEEATGGWEFGASFANRLVHLPVDSNWEQWRDWLASGKSDVDTAPTFTPEEWLSQWPRAKGLVLGFHESTGGRYLREKKKREGDAAGYEGRFPLAYCTPRTWEWAIALLAGCFAIGAEGNGMILELLTACLGEPSAQLAAAYVRSEDLPPVEPLLYNPAGFRPDPTRPDIVLSVATTAAELACLDKPDKVARWQGCARLLEVCRPINPALVVNAARYMAAHKPDTATLLQPAYQQLVKNLGPVLQGSGIVFQTATV